MVEIIESKVPFPIKHGPSSFDEGWQITIRHGARWIDQDNFLLTYQCRGEAVPTVMHFIHTSTAACGDPDALALDAVLKRVREFLAIALHVDVVNDES